MVRLKKPHICPTIGSFSSPSSPPCSQVHTERFSSQFHNFYSVEVFQLLLLEEDFLRFVRTTLLSFYVQPEAASPLIPWTPGLAFPGQQQQGGPPAFVLLKEIRKAESIASGISFLVFIGTFWLSNTVISILTSNQEDTWTDQHFQKINLLWFFGGGTLYFQRQRD